MRGGRDIETDILIVPCSAYRKGVEMGDMAGGRLASVGKNEGYGMGFWKAWELVALR